MSCRRYPSRDLKLCLQTGQFSKATDILMGSMFTVGHRRQQLYIGSYSVPVLRPKESTLWFNPNVCARNIRRSHYTDLIIGIIHAIEKIRGEEVMKFDEDINVMVNTNNRWRESTERVQALILFKLFVLPAYGDKYYWMCIRAFGEFGRMKIMSSVDTRNEILKDFEIMHRFGDVFVRELPPNLL